MEENNIQLASDEERRRAEAKQVTLQPVHDNVTPDPRPDAEIVANHMTGPAIANASNDTEETASFVQPPREVANQTTTPNERRDNPQMLKITLITGVAVVVAATAFFVTQSL